MTDISYRDPKLAELDRSFLIGPRPDEGAWYSELRHMLELAYLSSDDPYRQSGFGGDAERWRTSRRPMVDAVDRDGTFLDIGCANGLLIESVVDWAAEEGHRIEPYGLDYSEDIANLARRRLSHWQDRIFVGNAVDWQPPFRFDFVRTELVYVPQDRQAELVERLLTTFVSPGGRLIICSYGSSRQPLPRVEPIDEMLRGWVYEVSGGTQAAAPNGVTVLRVAWIDAMEPHR